MSSLWCVLLIFAGVAAILIGKRRRSRPNPPRVCQRRPRTHAMQR